MKTAQGNLVVLNAHTQQPEVFWNGQKIDGVERIHINADEDGGVVKLVVVGDQDQLYSEMVASGVTVKKGRVA